MNLPSVSRRAAVLLAAGLALVVLIGTSAAWVLTAKTVTLTVDGASRKVSLHGSTVGDVLRSEHLSAGPHDLLAPAAGSHVSDGSVVALRRGRQLTLDVDGVSRTVWVTASDVDQALQEIGLRTEGAALSASRSRPIGLDGLSLDVRLPKPASIAVDGATTPRTTTAATVAELLTEAGVTVRPADAVVPALTTPITTGLLVTVTRNDTGSVVQDVPIAFASVSTPDPTQYVGTQRVTSPGRPGSERRTYATTLVNGVETGRTLQADVHTAEPVTQQVAVGSKPKPAPVAPVAGAPLPTGGSGSGLNWAAVANCESGGNPHAVGGGGLYFGLYQFSVATWAAVGGSGNPASASPAEQTARAEILYARSGAGQWPVCGRFL